jgi:16S rRNA (uracil1498-N3)-methyltransferase
MTVRRLYAGELPEGGGHVTLDEVSSRHVRVLRMRVGDDVVLFDGSGRAANARISSLGDVVVCEADAPSAVAAKRAHVVLLLAIPKGSTLDDCVRMATELGVDEVALMRTERSVPRWDEARARSRVERLTRIASEASAQCERDDVPIIHAPQSLDAWIARFPESATGVMFGARAAERLELAWTGEQVWCAVGPEGGFTDGERESLEAAGFSIASLGRWVLRVDTAVAAALATVRDRLDASLQAR